MCSGRVDPEFVLRAFANGMDGVFIGGCRLNECNYLTHGNYDAWNMVGLMKTIMEYIGMNPERLTMAFMSSGEGQLFARTVDDFAARVKAAGPLGTDGEPDKDRIKSEMQRITRLVPYIKTAQKEKLAARLESEADHEGLFTADEVEALFRDIPSYYIDPDLCKACGICRKRCPVDAVDGGKKLVHVIDQELCIKCGTCAQVCPPKFSAVKTYTGEPAPPPVPEDQRVIEKAERGNANH
mgnify:FL=1